MVDYKNKITSGTLYIVATPIGNMGDITYRAIQVLQASDAIICEDTRVTNKLLQFYGIKKPMIVCNDYTEAAQVNRIISMLQQGQTLALVSDAGTPLIADPGYAISKAVRETGLQVASIPGPSSVITALTLAGLPTSNFVFIGFLSSKSTTRRRELKEVAKTEGTIICFETTRRLLASLEDVANILGNRNICMAREMTKIHEEIWHGDVTGLIAHCQQHKTLKGEVVLVIRGHQGNDTVDEEVIKQALQEALRHYPLSEAVRLVAAKLGLPRRVVYQCGIGLMKRD